MPADDFERSGYAILPTMVDADALQHVDAALRADPATLSDTRRMLRFAWCAALAENLRLQLVAARLLPGTRSACNAPCLKNRASITGW